MARLAAAKPHSGCAERISWNPPALSEVCSFVLLSHDVPIVHHDGVYSQALVTRPTNGVYSANEKDSHERFTSGAAVETFGGRKQADGLVSRGTD